MNIAIWIIAIVEVIRMLQNCIQIMQIKKANSNPQFERATDEFIKSLNKTDKRVYGNNAGTVKGAEMREIKFKNIQDASMYNKCYEQGRAK